MTIDDSLQFLRGFPDYLVAQGWEVHVVSSPGARLEALRTHDHVHVHPIPMKREPALLADLVSLIRWVALVRSIGPDVTSVGTPKAGLLGGIAALLNRVPKRVYVLRGLRLETTGGIKRQVLIALERVAVRSAHRVLSVSESLRQRAIVLGIVLPAKIAVLGAGSSNGVDPNKFRPASAASEGADLRAALGLVDGLPTLGFVGRLTADKGLDTLAETRRILVERAIDHQLLVVGGIDDHASPSVIDDLVTAGRPAIVTGRVSDTSPYYRLMDVFCLPTLREGFPNVVLEASASGIAVVTTNATGAIDSVVPGVTGLLAEVTSAVSFADQLEVLIGDRGRRKEIGASGREWVKSNFDRNSVWKRTEAFYSSRTN